jgi:hypothetical protein
MENALKDNIPLVVSGHSGERMQIDAFANPRGSVMLEARNPPTVPPANDHETTCDCYGMAALLLTESLIHGMCENKIISTGQAVDIVKRAASVQHERATQAEHGSASKWRSHDLIVKIAKSLRADLKLTPFTPTLVP